MILEKLTIKMTTHVASLCVDAYSITDPLLTSSEWNHKPGREATDKPWSLSYLLQLSLRMQIFIDFCIGQLKSLFFCMDVMLLSQTIDIGRCGTMKLS